MSWRCLTPEHFAMDVVHAARDLIGRRIYVAHDDDTVRRGVIVETEAYGGPDDPASHAAFKPNGRAAVMFGDPGVTYVYAAYGMYPCLNIVTGPPGTPSAVLIRGVWMDGDKRPTLGPGRTTRALGVTLADHNARLGERLNVGAARQMLQLTESPRVGITRGVETPWRFVAINLAADMIERDRCEDGDSQAH